MLHPPEPTSGFDLERPLNNQRQTHPLISFFLFGAQRARCIWIEWIRWVLEAPIILGGILGSESDRDFYSDLGSRRSTRGPHVSLPRKRKRKRMEMGWAKRLREEVGRRSFGLGSGLAPFLFLSHFYFQISIFLFLYFKTYNYVCGLNFNFNFICTIQKL
jgi:hypothetical protein